MVQQKESVVTPERFAAGMTYPEYIASIERNQKRFEENYDEMTVSPEHVAAFKALMAKPGGPAKLLVIGEDWCPDVFRGMPVFARLAEATGLEIRIFKRDENKDVISEFLKDGEFESIPVAVFYTKDMQEITHFIERPELAYEEMRTTLRPMYERFRKPDMTEEERAKVREDNIAFQHGPIWSNWRQETISQCLRQLEAKVGA
jgi:thiol-disulfide isomerase/thioredoxin